MRFSLIAVAVLALAACATPAPQQHVSQARAAVAIASASPGGPATVRTAVPSSVPPTAAPVAAKPAPTSTPVASPIAAATPAPSVAASPTPASAGSATLPSASIPELPANAPPQIVALEINKTVVRSGETVSGVVRTSSNVASVEARIATYSVDVPKVAPGQFALSYAVPNIPFFLHHTYDMVVIARNTAGVETTKTVPITIR